MKTSLIKHSSPSKTSTRIHTVPLEQAIHENLVAEAIVGHLAQITLYSVRTDARIEISARTGCCCKVVVRFAYSVQRFKKRTTTHMKDGRQLSRWDGAVRYRYCWKYCWQKYRSESSGASHSRTCQQSPVERRETRQQENGIFLSPLSPVHKLFSFLKLPEVETHCLIIRCNGVDHVCRYLVAP